jgi:site-specific recombinase XerD
MQNTLRDYEQYCKHRLHLRPSTLRLRTTELTIFLGFLHSRRARTLDQIQAADLSEFVTCQDHLQAETVARIVSDVRSFLRFLTLRGILQKDLSAELPKIRVPRDATIPSVWDYELIVRLLGGVDRSSAKGKRDYAILLLACRLGLRAGDILAVAGESLVLFQRRQPRAGVGRVALQDLITARDAILHFSHTYRCVHNEQRP